MSVAETNVAKLCLALEVRRAASVNFGAVAGNRQCMAGQSEDKRRSRGKLLIINWLSRGISGVRSSRECVSHSLLWIAILLCGPDLGSNHRPRDNDLNPAVLFPAFDNRVLRHRIVVPQAFCQDGIPRLSLVNQVIADRSIELFPTPHS